MRRDKHYIFRKNTIAAIAFVTILCLCNTSSAEMEDLSINSDMIKYQSSDGKKPRKRKFTHFTSGTGFFVSNNYIVTNEHVVQNCKMIKVRGAIKPSHAKIQAVDKSNDLALLKTPRSPSRIAKLRGEEIPVNIGEEVTVMGYPLEHGINGSHLLRKAVITDTEDVYEGNKRLQFTDSVEKGNSGGPLLDQNGNVIGVVVGKMSFYLADSGLEDATKAEPVKTSSMAISLDNLKSFLKHNNIFYKEDKVHYDYADKWMERKAKQYIVNVHCVKS